MYRKPRFLEELHAIREEMSREADYDVELFAEMVRSGTPPRHGPVRHIRGFRTRAPRAGDAGDEEPKPAPKKRASR
ncbi:MAG: hypothetical protein QOJ70_2347 [Acidobacteriota bacterium]|jgi:hypothetical protein|nr:hypothetical protein [Acidobacteriota bacterium]